MAEETQENPRDTVCAIVTTFNEEREIGDCIESLAWCDHILVVDSYSTDRTVEIVRSFPDVELFQHKYYGSAAQKNWAMDRTRCDWNLIFDADERCTDKLRDEILELLSSNPKETSFRVRRRLFFLSKHIRFCGWHNDLVVRLTRRGHARYPNRRVHADMVTSGASPALKNPLDHYMVRDLGEYVHRICKYGIWGAAQGFKDNRRSGIPEVALRPMWRFFRAYIVQLGFLDGIPGLIFCTMQAFGTFVKWGVLWGWRFTGDPRLPEFDESEETWKDLGATEDSGETAALAPPTG